MSNKKLYQVGLIAAILSTAGWFVYILGNTGGPDLSLIDDPKQYFQALQDIRSTRLLYGWGGVLGALLTIPYILAFHYATEDAGSVRIVATTTAVIGAVLTAVGFMSTALASVYFLLPMALEAAPETLAMMKIAATFSTRVFEVMWWVGSFLAYGLGVGLMAVQEDQGVVNISIYVALTAMALCLAKYNRFAALKD